MSEGRAKPTQIAHAGDAIRLVGYLCYPSDIRVTEEAEAGPVARWRLHGFELCPEEYVGRCALRRGLQGEGVGGCHRVEVTIDVAYSGIKRARAG